MIEARWRLVACVSVLVFATGVDAASRLTKVVDSFDQVPGAGTGVAFVLPGTAAAHKNGIFVFQAEVSGVKGLWRSGPAPAAFTRLVDGNTAIPSGSGFFRDLVPFRFDGNSVVFRGDDQFEFGGQAGYYAQPVAGGAPTMLANQGTLVPPANTVSFGTNIGFPGGTQEQMALDAGTLVFADDREAGNYAIPVPAGPLRALGTTAFAICETGNFLALIWANPEISGNTVVMGIGGGAGAALYAFPLGGVSGIVDACATPRLRANNGFRIASRNVAMPGGGANFDAFAFNTLRIDGDRVVFRGGNGLGRFGIYSSATDGSGLIELVSTETPVPGGVGNFQGPVAGLSLDRIVIGGEVVVFRGTDASAFQGVYAVPVRGGQVVEIVRANDMLPDGRTVFAAGGAALAPELFNGDSMDGRSLALRIDFTDPQRGFGSGIYAIDLPGALFADGFENP
ncbi:MAG: hypothetical protein KA911_09440 [Xanthomonadales bacterium]|nr:hypothetical protein [Xanthomonadales bacterium]MBP7639035.1 hypothetical protein [Kiritimatiellia bacterium]